MSYFLTDDNTKLYYEVTGKGTKNVVLIHGWSASHLFYKKQIPVLSESYKVISYDLRGHGLSEESKDGYTIPRYAQDLKNLIDHLNLKNVVLVGWSMGTHILLEYIKQFGCDNLDKIVIIDMSAKLITDESYKCGLYGKFTYQDNLDTMGMMNKNWKEFTATFVPAIFAKSGCADQELLKWTYEEEYKNSTSVMIRMWLSMSSQDYRDVLPKINVPALITFGLESVLFIPENSEYLSKMISGSKLVAFPKCGHSLQLEDSDKLNKELKDFIG